MTDLRKEVVRCLEADDTNGIRRCFQDASFAIEGPNVTIQDIITLTALETVFLVECEGQREMAIQNIAAIKKDDHCHRAQESGMTAGQTMVWDTVCLLHGVVHSDRALFLAMKKLANLNDDSEERLLQAMLRQNE